MKKVIFTVPLGLDTRKKTWRKHLTGVDKNKRDGYAFEGSWLVAGEKSELPVNSLVLCYDEPGSMKNWYSKIRLFRLQHDGDLELIYEKDCPVNFRSWALFVRDEIADILIPPSEKEKWAMMYENSVDCGFNEWWEISDGETIFRTDIKDDAEWLCNKLNEG